MTISIESIKNAFESNQITAPNPIPHQIIVDDIDAFLNVLDVELGPNNDVSILVGKFMGVRVHQVDYLAYGMAMILDSNRNIISITKYR